MMKFQKINIMLMIAVLSSNLSFCPEGEPAKLTPLTQPNEYSHEDYERALDNLQQDKDRYTTDTIKKKYRALAPLHHPDTGGDTENFKTLKSSFDYANKHIENPEHQRFFQHYREIKIQRENARQEQEAARQEAARQEAARKKEEYAKRVEAARERARKAAEGDKGTEPIISGQDRTSSKVIDMSANDLATNLTPDEVQALTPETIQAITSDPAKLKALLQNTPALKALSPEQVKAIPADKLVEAINKDLSAVLKTRQSLPDSFVDKLSPTQAKALVDEHSKWFSSIKADFSDEQIEHLRSLAKTQEGSTDEVMTRATTLTKRLAKGNLTPEEQNQFDTYMSKLNTKEKENIINQYADSLAEASGLKKEKNSWFFKDDKKIKDLNNKLTKTITEFSKKYTNGDEYPILLRVVKTNDLVIEVVDMSKINPTESMENQFSKLFTDKTLSDKINTTKDKHNVLENSYARWFSDRIDLSKPFDTNVQNILPEQTLGGELKAAPRFEEFDSKLQEKINSELTQKVNEQFLKDHTKVNPDFIKYVTPENVTPEILSMLSVNQVKALTSEQIRAFTPDHIKNISEEQFNALDIDQKTALRSKLSRLSDNELTSIEKYKETSKSIKSLIARIKETKSVGLTAAKQAEITNALTSPNATAEMINQYKDELMNLDTATLGKIINKASVPSVQRILMDEISTRFLQDPKSFDPKLMKYLTIDSLTNMSSSHFKDLNGKQLDALNIRLTSSSEQNLSHLIYKSTSVEVSDLAKNALFLKDPSKIALAYIPDITSDTIRKLSPELVEKLTDLQIKALKPAQIAELSNAQITKMNPETHTAFLELFKKMPNQERVDLVDQTKSYILSNEILSNSSLDDLINDANLSADEHINARTAARTLINSKFLEDPSLLSADQITKFISRRTITLLDKPLQPDQLEAVKTVILTNPAETSALEDKALINMKNNAKSSAIKELITEIQKSREKNEPNTNKKTTSNKKTGNRSSKK